MRSKAELEALLESISTPDPTLRVRGVVKTPDVEGKLSKDGKVLPGGVKKSESPSPLLGEPRVVQSLRLAVIPFLTTREGTRQHLPTVFLDDPNLDEEGRRQVYAVLACIPWLHKSIRTAIRKHGLGRSVEQDDRAAYKLQTSIFEEDIKHHKAAGMSVEAAYEKLSRQTDIDVDTLKKRLQRK